MFSELRLYVRSLLEQLAQESFEEDEQLDEFASSGGGGLVGAASVPEDVPLKQNKKSKK